MSDPIKPNLLVIGAMKASTTLFYRMLGRHPQVWFPAEKEPHYFTSPEYGDANAYRLYLQHFASSPPGKTIVGEASTGYSKIPYLGPTPKRIRETLGRPRLIYLLRDPVQRTISNFQHAFARGYYRAGYRISRAVVEDPIIIGASQYARQLSAYEAEFGRGSVLVLIAEELHRDPGRVMGEVEDFLEIESFDQWDGPVENVNSSADVRRAVVVDSLLAKSSFIRRAGRFVPRWMKSGIRNFAPRALGATQIEPYEEELIFRLVADDLQKLHERLGDRIACWPSVRKLEGIESPVRSEIPIKMPQEQSGSFGVHFGN